MTGLINITMKINDILIEAPLPPDWDKDKFKSNTPFIHRVNYAKERAKRIGTGSSRIAFEIEYEGRPTILKVAKNKKGIAQNEYESQMFNDYYVEGLEITIPMIDHDEENDPPTWIHTEKAEKMKPTDFKKFFNGMGTDETMQVVNYLVGKTQSYASDEDIERYNQLYEDNEYIMSLVDLVGNYDVHPGDFRYLPNWGIYKGQPVIIDIGASTEVISSYYS